MAEEMGRGMFASDGDASRGKVSYEPVVHDGNSVSISIYLFLSLIHAPGLASGDILALSLWSQLTDSDGKPTELSKVSKENTVDVVVVYADPRRLTDECKLIVNEFNKIPQKELKVSLAVVNCDDSNDLRKFLKKNSGVSFSILSDKTKVFMDAAKCRSNNRLLSSLFLLEVNSGKIIKVWYENDWDAFTTKDLIVEEVKEYRKNPQQYILSQTGIR